MTSDSNCLFCKIVNKEIPASFEYEDETVVAFKDIKPEAPIHILIIPRRHLSGLNDLDTGSAELMSKLMLAAKDIAANKGLRDSGYRLIINCGRDAGQAVEHIHVHLLGGRPMNWPPG